MNKYLYKVAEHNKEAILESLLVGAASHAAQNLAVKGLLRSKPYAQQVANAARAGFEGKGYSNLGVSALSGVAGTEVKEIPHLANLAAKGLRNHLDSKGHVMTKHDHLALRMMSQGRFSDLEKLHKSTKGKTTSIISHTTDYLKNSHGLDASVLSHANHTHVSNLFKKPSSTLSMFSKDNYPLLNNISHNITKGKSSSSPGKYHHLVEPAVTGALSISEPVAGAFNYGKQFLASNTAQKIPVVKKTFDWVNKQFMNSASSSMVAGAKKESSQVANKFLSKIRDSGLAHAASAQYSKVKNMSKGVLVNGLSGEVDRTAHAIGAASTRGARAEHLR